MPVNWRQLAVMSIISEIERRPSKTMTRRVRKRTTLHNSRLIASSISKLTMRQRAAAVNIITAPHRGRKKTITGIPEEKQQIRPLLLISRTRNLSAPSLTQLISSSSTTRRVVKIQHPVAVYNEDPPIDNSKSCASADQAC